MRDKIKEYAAVEEAAMKFVKSVAEGDSSHAKEFLTESWNMDPSISSIIMWIL